MPLRWCTPAHQQRCSRAPSSRKQQEKKPAQHRGRGRMQKPSAQLASRTMSNILCCLAHNQPSDTSSPASLFAPLTVGQAAQPGKKKDIGKKGNTLSSGTPVAWNDASAKHATQQAKTRTQLYEPCAPWQSAQPPCLQPGTWGADQAPNPKCKRGAQPHEHTHAYTRPQRAFSAISSMRAAMATCTRTSSFCIAFTRSCTEPATAMQKATNAEACTTTRHTSNSGLVGNQGRCCTFH